MLVPQRESRACLPGPQGSRRAATDPHHEGPPDRRWGTNMGVRMPGRFTSRRKAEMRSVCLRYAGCWSRSAGPRHGPWGVPAGVTGCATHQGRGHRRLLQEIRYKADWYGTLIVEADRFFPSGKLCSDCGDHNGELGREAYWTCPRCGVRHDRNENAALNLVSVALKAVDDLPDQIILGPVGPDVTLPDGKALAGGERVAGETGPDERENCSIDAVSNRSRRRVCWQRRQPNGSGYSRPAPASHLIIAYLPDNPERGAKPGTGWIGASR